MIRARTADDAATATNNIIIITSSSTATPQQQAAAMTLLINSVPHDLSVLNDIELAHVLAQALEAFDLMGHQAQSQQNTIARTRFATLLVKSLNTVPWSRVFGQHCVQSNLDASAATAPAATAAAAASTPSTLANSEVSAKKLQRAFPNSSKDIAATKSTRRRIIMLFGLIAIRTAELLPSVIPELLAAALKFFVSLPPIAQVSVQKWLDIPSPFEEDASAATGGAAASSSSSSAAANATSTAAAAAAVSTSPIRDFGAAIHGMMETDVDAHLFRVMAMLLVKQQESHFQTQQQQQQQQNSKNKAAASAAGTGAGGVAVAAAMVSSSNKSTSGQNTAFAALSSSAQLLLRNPCHIVLEKSVPQKRWPVFVHHLSWFSVMSKFFHRNFVDAIAKAMESSSSGGGGGGGGGEAAALRAHATLTQLWRGPILRMMLSGLANLEVNTKQKQSQSDDHHQNTRIATVRRCAAIVVDALVNSTLPSELPFVKPQQPQQAAQATVALFKQVLSHFSGTVVYTPPPFAAVHSVALCTAIALDKATNGATRCVGLFIQECCSKLGQMLDSKSQSSSGGNDIFSAANNKSRDDDLDDVDARGGSGGFSLRGLPRVSDSAADATGTEQLLCFSHTSNALRCIVRMCNSSAEIKSIVGASLAAATSSATAATAGSSENNSVNNINNSSAGGANNSNKKGGSASGGAASASDAQARGVLARLAQVCAARAQKKVSSAAWLLTEVLTPLAGIFDISLPAPPSPSPSNNNNNNNNCSAASGDAAIILPSVAKQLWTSYINLSQDLLSF